MGEHTIIQTIDILCLGRLHRISLTSKGRLIFHNHPGKFMSEKALVALGGTSCACHNFLSLWRSCAQNKFRLPIPDTLKLFAEHLAKCRSLSLSREQRFYKSDVLQASLLRNINRKSYMTHNAFLKTLKLCQNSPLSLCKKISLSFSFLTDKKSVPTISYRREKQYDPTFGIIETGFVLHVSVLSLACDWYEKVYKKGLALIDGHLVLGVLEDCEDKKLKVYAVPVNFPNDTPISAQLKIVSLNDAVPRIVDFEALKQNRS